MVSKEEILKKTRQGLDVFRYYIPGEWKVGKNFRNPFYADKNASANVWRCHKTGTYLFKDFGNEDFSGDCFSLVAYLNGWDCSRREDFIAILTKIARDLNIQEDSWDKPTSNQRVNRSMENKQGTKVPEGKNEGKEQKGVVTGVKEFSATELSWWEKYHITATTLAHYRVESVVGVRFANSQWESSEQHPCYLYTYGKNNSSRKIYSPRSQARFVYLQKSPGDYFGFEQLPEKGEMVILTGGEKDVLTLASVGYAAFSMNSETADVPESLMKELKERFRYIAFLYDMDETGKRCSKKLVSQYAATYPVIRIELPLSGEKTEKDVSDYAGQFAEKGLFGKMLATHIKAALRNYHEGLLASYQAGIINYNKPPEKPEAIVKISNELIAAPGDLICITGGTGTGKSNYTSCLIAGALNIAGKEADTLGLQIKPDPDRKAILYFDTEQSEYQSYRNLEILFQRIGMKEHPEHLIMVNLCKTDRRKRVALIAKYMETYGALYQGIYLVVIDGLADLISSANEETESIQLVEFLQKQTQAYQTVIAGVIHTAGVADKVRGHLGSEFTRKASAVICIEKDKKGQQSLVKPLKVRAGSISRIGVMNFHWDEHLKRHVS